MKNKFYFCKGKNFKLISSRSLIEKLIIHLMQATYFAPLLSLFHSQYRALSHLTNLDWPVRLRPFPSPLVFPPYLLTMPEHPICSQSK